MLITQEKINKDTKANVQIGALSIFGIVGLFLPVMPFLFADEIDINTWISCGFFLLVFGIPFGYFIGLKKIIYVLNVNSCLKKGDFKITIDEITDLAVTIHGESSDMDSRYCQLTLLNYSKKSKKTISVTFKEYKKLKVGDKCILVFTKHDKLPYLVYPGNQYEIDMDLMSKVCKEV